MERFFPPEAPLQLFVASSIDDMLTSKDQIVSETLEAWSKQVTFPSFIRSRDNFKTRLDETIIKMLAIVFDNEEVYYLPRIVLNERDEVIRYDLSNAMYVYLPNVNHIPDHDPADKNCLTISDATGECQVMISKVIPRLNPKALRENTWLSTDVFLNNWYRWNRPDEYILTNIRTGWQMREEKILSEILSGI